MTEIARLEFGGADAPAEQGALLLHGDGTFQVEPSGEYRDALAGLERAALARTEAYGTRLGLTLIVAGAAAVAAGWYLGRAYGSLARNLIAPRAIQDVRLTRDARGGLRLRMPGAEHRWQTVTQEWQAGALDAPEAAQFLRTYEEMRG